METELRDKIKALSKKLAIKFWSEWQKNNYTFSDGKTIEIWIKNILLEEIPSLIIEHNKQEAEKRFNEAMSYINALYTNPTNKHILIALIASGHKTEEE